MNNVLNVNKYSFISIHLKVVPIFCNNISNNPLTNINFKLCFYRVQIFVIQCYAQLKLHFL